jgi:hypothetical protein
MLRSDKYLETPEIGAEILVILMASALLFFPDFKPN